MLTAVLSQARSIFLSCFHLYKFSVCVPPINVGSPSRVSIDWPNDKTMCICMRIYQWFNLGLHEDVIAWELFLHNWPFVTGIHWFTHKRSIMQSVFVFLLLHWKNCWSNSSPAYDLGRNSPWFESPWSINWLCAQYSGRQQTKHQSSLSLVTGGSPSQLASDEKKVSMSLRLHL